MNKRASGDENNTGTLNFYGSDYSLHFRELYNAGILDFKAEECSYENSSDNEKCDSVNIQKSKAFNDGTFYYNGGWDDFNYYLGYDTNYDFLPLKIFKQIDEKMDDGIPDKGSVEVISDTDIYDYDEENQHLGEMLFELDL